MRWTLAWAVLLLGCHDLDEFASGDGVFRGEIIGSDGDVFRQGFPPHTVLELSFEPELAEGRQGPGVSPGRVTTHVCAPSATECEQRSDGPIVDAELQPFDALQHDVLGDYDFPGPGRVRNYILSVRTVAGDDAMVFVSLMEAGGIELRVMAAAPEPDGEPFFGVFPLKRGKR